MLDDAAKGEVDALAEHQRIVRDVAAVAWVDRVQPEELKEPRLSGQGGPPQGPQELRLAAFLPL